jgi:hypothetical protein
MRVGRHRLHSRLRRVLSDIRRGRYIEAYLGLGIAIAAIAVEILSGFSGDNKPADVVFSTAVVILLGIVAFATIEIRRDMPSPTSVGRRLAGFFTNRAELPSLHDQLELARREVHIFGLQLGQVTHTLLPLLEERARAGCAVRLALTSPVDRSGQALDWIDEVGDVHCFPNLADVLRVNLRRLQTWHAGLEETVRARVEIKAYDRVPTASIIMYDTDTRRGYIHVEPILFRFNPDQRPILWLREADNPDLFRLVKSKYMELWHQGIPLQELRV